MTKRKPYPYQTHTNRELELMLAGKKPLAVFAHEHTDGFEKSCALAGQDFALYVANGILSEHSRTFESVLPNGSRAEIDYYFYALPGEEWRVPAYCLLLDMLEKRGWCSHLEWLQGTLLGYTDQQNRFHLSQLGVENSSDH